MPIDPGSISQWVQTLAMTAGFLAGVVASHQRIVAGMQRLDERMRDHSTVVSNRLEHVERELDMHGRQLQEHALVLARLEQALGSSSIPFPVIVERLAEMKEEIEKLRDWRHETGTTLQHIVSEQAIWKLRQESPAPAPAARASRRTAVKASG